MTLHVIGSGKRPEDVTGEMAERIKDLIYEYAATYRLPLASAMGVLTIVQLELMREHHE